MNQSTISTQSKSSEVPYALSQVPLQLNRYFGLVLFISGNLTLVGNAIVFSSKSFRKRACSVYILVEAFMNIFYFNYVLLTRMLQRGFGIPIMIRYEFFCKTRQFASVYVHQVVITLFVLTTIDRILSVQRSASKYTCRSRPMLHRSFIHTALRLEILPIHHYSRLILFSVATMEQSYLTGIQTFGCESCVLVSICLSSVNILSVNQWSLCNGARLNFGIRWLF